jgi:probable F420-dependent oxidoreductase
MTDRRGDLRAALGRVGVWSFALQAHTAASERAAIGEYDAMGYRATWFPESIGSKEAFAHAALLLGGSPRIVVASGIANIYARDPMAMVNGGRTLAEAYPGRFVLGIGVSHASSVATRGGTYGRPLERMTAYLDAMEAATWVGPAPSERLPVVLAALGPRMLELAAARTDGAHSYFVPPEHTALARERLGEGALLAVEQTAVLDTDPGRAREVARGFAARYLSAPNYANNLRRLSWSEEDLSGGGSDRLIDALVVQGDAGIAGRVRSTFRPGADRLHQLRAIDAADLCLTGCQELRAAPSPRIRTRGPPGVTAWHRFSPCRWAVTSATAAPDTAKEGSMDHDHAVRMLRAITIAFDRHDIDAILVHFAEDAVFESPRGTEPWGRQFTGRQEIRDAFAARFSGIPDVRYQQDGHFVDGDRGASEWTLSGTTTDKQRIEVRGCDLWTIRDGRIVRGLVLEDRTAQ